jgi:hypothetical protein
MRFGVLQFNHHALIHVASAVAFLSKTRDTPLVSVAQRLVRGRCKIHVGGIRLVAQVGAVIAILYRKQVFVGKPCMSLVAWTNQPVLPLPLPPSSRHRAGSPEQGVEMDIPATMRGANVYASSMSIGCGLNRVRTVDTFPAELPLLTSSVVVCLHVHTIVTFVAGEKSDARTLMVRHLYI